MKTLTWRAIYQLVLATVLFVGIAGTLFYGIEVMRPQKIFTWASIAYGISLPVASGKKGHHNISDLRMNHIQVIGTHNSYHREISRSERDIFEKFVPAPWNYYYSHAQWADQFDYQYIRSGEIDLHSDTVGGLYAFPAIWKLSNLTSATAPWQDPNMYKPGLKVHHITDIDTNAICHTFTECLGQLKNWSDAHPNHLPLTFDLELKTDALACGLGGVCAEEATTWTTDRILNVDREILSILPRTQLITPDDIRRNRTDITLEAALLQYGWPTLESARGKFMFYFDNEVNATDNIRALYTANGHESLQDRIVFTNSLPGLPDAAVIKYNDPTNYTAIQDLVRRGYFVRTRADDPLATVYAHDTTPRENALMSAAQIVSTDFPAWGMSSRWDWDYAVQLGGGRVARCNPVSAPSWCRDAMVQDGVLERRLWFE